MVRPVVIKSYGVITVPPYNLIVYLLKHPDTDLYTIKNKSYFNFKEPEECDIYEWDSTDKILSNLNSDISLNHFTDRSKAEEAFKEAIKYEKQLILDTWDDVSKNVISHKESST